MLTGQLGSGALVVGTSRSVAGEIPLKFRIQFAEVVPEPGVIGGFAPAEGTAEFTGQFGHRPKVFHQTVPSDPRRWLSAHGSRASSTPGECLWGVSARVFNFCLSVSPGVEVAHPFPTGEGLQGRPR